VPEMTVNELIDLISDDEGEIYPFSYAANMMAAYGVNDKLVEYFHKAAANANLVSHDRSCILTDFRNATNESDEYKHARYRSFKRLNPHWKEL